MAASMRNIKNTRLSYITHMSKARTISTAYVSVKSCTEPILKMLEEFHMRILYYV